MSVWTQIFTRRTLLGTAVLVPFAGCATATKGPQAQPSPAPPVAAIDPYVALEEKYDARIGVFAIDTGTGAELNHRADERFAFCSTYKTLAAAAILHQTSPTQLNASLTYTAADVLAHSPITEQHVATGMTIRALCEAAVRNSDNTAANLLVREVGGPSGVTDFARTLGDIATRMDRLEPALNEAIPGDPRDTTTPRAFGTDYQKLVVDGALDSQARTMLTEWLVNNTTGSAGIRSSAPAGWQVGDKTGSGYYGSTNDIAVIWPPGAKPIVLAIMSSRTTKNAVADSTLIADATRVVINVIGK